VDIAIANTALADIVLLKHGPEPPNVEPRTSVCAWRGVHFVEENCFRLRFGRREWLLEKGCAFVGEPGRIHKYSHQRQPRVVMLDGKRLDVDALRGATGSSGRPESRLCRVSGRSRWICRFPAASFDV
jgi:hypothetical protein